jgi:hypothetical protein
LVVVVVLRASAARAEPWVDRQLTLGPWKASFDFGAGGTARGGAGTNVEWTLGLPLVAELGVRTGARFDGEARLAGSDAYARLFDHESSDLGAARWSNPELRLRAYMVDLRFVAIGLEGRLVVPAAQRSVAAFAPAVPVRFRWGHRVRVDTGLFVPLRFDRDLAYSISVPVALWIQLGDAFVGPMTGVRLGHDAPPFASTSAASDRVDVALGAGAGVALGARWELRAQIYSPRINDAERTRLLGFGLGTEVRAP